jgi:hypothetical protein
VVVPQSFVGLTSDWRWRLESLQKSAKAGRTLLVGVAVWAAGAVISFRFVILSSFDLIFGDRGDGRLIIWLHEHLFQALIGHAQWLSPPMFFPQADVLGFSDAFTLDVLPYAMLRLIGLDPFLSFQVLAISLSLCCFLACLLIATRYLRLRSPLAICAAVLVTFPNNLMFKTDIGHSNFFAIYYLPCIICLALWGIEDFPRLTRWSLVRTGAAGILFGLLFATGYYTAWMFALTLLIALCTAAVMLRRCLVAAAKDHRKPAIELIAIGAGGFVIGLIPFGLIYSPVLAIVPGRSYADYISFAPNPQDVIDVSQWNLMWGWLVKALIDNGGPERTLSVTPGMTLIFLILAYRFQQPHDPFGKAWQTVFAGACASVWFFSWLLTVKIGTFSLFWLVSHVVPGAAAIRCGGRIQLIVNMWLVAGFAVSLQAWMDAVPASRLRMRKLSGAVIVAFCLTEQINLLPVRFLSRSGEIASLSMVSPPHVGCRAFLVNIASQPANYLDDNDAMWISWRTGLPTLNGISGWSPLGWHLENPGIDYFDAARRWIALTGLNQQVCLYDRTTHSWREFR